MFGSTYIYDPRRTNQNKSNTSPLCESINLYNSETIFPIFLLYEIFCHNYRYMFRHNKCHHTHKFIGDHVPIYSGHNCYLSKHMQVCDFAFWVSDHNRNTTKFVMLSHQNPIRFLSSPHTCWRQSSEQTQKWDLSFLCWFCVHPIILWFLDSEVEIISG